MEWEIFSEISSLMEINYVALMTETFLILPEKGAFLRAHWGATFPPAEKKLADTIMIS